MSKVMVKGMDIPVDQLKPSPYQPRLTFDLEDIKGSIMRDGILVTLTVRKKDGFYEMVDGERRLRVAKELGYKTVPCDIIDIDDDTARRMVWKVNTLRKDYEPKEKALFFKTMQKEYGMSLRGITIEYDTEQHMVRAYLNVFKLPEDYQRMVWDRVIPIGVIRELEQLFNGLAYAIPQNNPEIFELLNRAATEKRFGQRAVREAVRGYLAKLREEQVERAKEAIAEIEPEVKPPETPEELEEAAKALRKRAKELKTPEQILEEKREKARKSLLSEPSSVVSRIEKAKELGIDTRGFEKQVEKIKAKITPHPDEALIDSKVLKRQVNELIKDFQEKQREAKIREEAKREAEIEARAKLMEDTDFLKKAAEKGRELTSYPEIPKIERPQLPIEISAELKERAREMEEEYQAFLLRDDVRERGEDFKNWMAHNYVLNALMSIRCPTCGKGWQKLVWACGEHEPLNLKEACEKLREKLEAS